MAPHDAALEEARAKLQHESERVALLAELSTVGLVSSTFKDIAERAARRVAEILGDFCVIRAVRDGRLEPVAWYHRAEDARPLVEALLLAPDQIESRDIYRQLAATRQSIVIDDPGRRERDVPAPLRPLFDRYGARHGVTCPVLTEDQLLGALTVFRSGMNPYSPDDVRVLEAVTFRLALALENSRLFEQAQREADEARRARAAADEASRVKDEFLATLSHELRTPLNAILGWAQLLRDAALPEHRRRAAIETIVRNAKAQEQLIAEILDVQRIMAGKLRLEVRSVDLGDVVRAAAQTVQPSADARNIKLDLLLDATPAPMSGDFDRLQQVAWNLLTNAIKFTLPGGRVCVNLQHTDADCVMIVEDDGPGIPADFLPHVFERFRQADSSSTRVHRGLGLGLAIVRNLVEMHGGTIEASNVDEPGRTGARFTIRLPRRGASDAAVVVQVAAERQQAEWLAQAPSLHDIRVLVVDDDRDARELVGTMLEQFGAGVALAGSAEEGMQAVLERRPHVLLTDIGMPHEDGYAFIRRIRALPPESGGNLAAAALTAYASASDRTKALSAGFDVHLVKPVQPVELAITVASLAGKTLDPRSSQKV